MLGGALRQSYSRVVRPLRHMNGSAVVERQLALSPRYKSVSACSVVGLNVMKLLGHFLVWFKGGDTCHASCLLGSRQVCQVKLGWFKWPLGFFLGSPIITPLFSLINYSCQVNRKIKQEERLKSKIGGWLHSTLLTLRTQKKQWTTSVKVSGIHPSLLGSLEFFQLFALCFIYSSDNEICQCTS